MVFELTSEEQLVVRKLRELGNWGSLTVIKQNGKIERIEKTEQEKVALAKGGSSMV